MRMCEESKVAPKKPASFPEVCRGETILIKDTSYYLVVSAPSAVGAMRLISLHSGNMWNYHSLWGDLKPEQVKKVNLCFKECDCN